MQNNNEFDFDDTQIKAKYISLLPEITQIVWNRIRVLNEDMCIPAVIYKSLANPSQCHPHTILHTALSPPMFSVAFLS